MATLFDGYLSRKEPEPWAPPRQKFLSARRFVLDSEASAFLGELVRRAGFEIIKQHEFARAPYDLTWIEHDQRAYWRAANAREPDSDSDGRVGFLLDGKTLWTIADATGREAILLPITYRLGEPVSPDHVLGVAQIFGLSPSMLRRTIIGSSGIPENKLDGQEVIDFVRYNCLDWSPVASDFIELKERQTLLRASAGDVKKMVALLLLLARPGEYGLQLTGTPRSAGLSRGRRVVYFDHHAVTLHLERGPAVTRFVRDLRGIERRRHEVRGHWCQTRRRGQGCEHTWARVDDRRYECSRCGAKRWWKPVHLRGNAAVGYVTKSYEVTR